MLEPESVGGPVQFVNQEGAYHAQRVFLGEKSQGVRPGVQIQGRVVGPLIEHLAAPFPGAEQSKGLVLLELFSRGGLIQRESAAEPGEIVVVDAVDNFPGGERAAAGQQVHDVEVEGDVLVRKALCLEGLVERVVGDSPAVNREEDVLAGGILAEGHVIANPALDSAPLVVIAAGAFDTVLLPALEAIDIEFPHIVPDARKVLDQFVVRHRFHLPGLWPIVS